MRVNYINISLLLVILLISIIIIIYHNKRKYYLDELESYKDLLFNLGNKNEIIEDFSSITKLKIEKIYIENDSNDDKQIVVEGENLNHIDIGVKGIYFGNIKLTWYNSYKIENQEKIIIFNFHKKLNREYKKSENNLELKFLFRPFVGSNAMLFPTNLYYRRIGGDNWSLFHGKKNLPTENIDEKEFSPVRQYVEKIKELVPKEDKKRNEYEIKNLDIKIDSKDIKQIEMKWDIPRMVNSENYAFVLNFTPKSDSNKDMFKIENEILAFNTSKYTFSNRRLIPFKEYNVSIKIIEYKPVEKLIGGIETEYTFKPYGNKKHYHSHKYDELKDGKFSSNETDETSESLINTYYELMAYNKSKSVDDLLQHKQNYKTLGKNIEKNVYDLTRGNHLDKFDKTFIDNINKYTDMQGTDFKNNQLKQNEKIERVKYKLEQLEDLKNKKNDKEDLIIKSVQSFSSGTILRLKDLGNLNKLVLLNNGCLAFDKNNLGKIKSIGYIPCNQLDPEQQFQIKRIGTIEDYNLLLSLSLEENIDEKSKKDFRPFFVLQPIGTNKCVHINNNNLSIKNCMETDDIKFKGNFVGSKCNL